MPQEDYLQKYLEKLSRVIAAMFGFRQGGFPEDALRLAEETIKELLHFDIDELAIMPMDKFIDIVKNGSYSSSRLDLLAQIAHQTALSFSAVNNADKAYSYYSKALQLYYLLNEKDKTYSMEREMIIGELRMVVDGRS